MPKYLLEGHKLHYHPDVLLKFMREEIFAPVTVEISPSARCNEKCKHCYTAYLMKPGISPVLMDEKLYFKVIKDCSDFGVKSICLAGTGEPMLHPKTPAVISYAKKLGLDVSLTTNGVLATKNKMESCLGDLTWIRFSVSAGTPQRYAELQGSTEEAFHAMMDNLRDLVEIKRKNNLDTSIGVAYFLFEKNNDDIMPFVTELKNIGVDYVQIKPCGDFEKDNYVYKKDIYKIRANELEEVAKLNSNDFYCQVKYESFHRLEEIEKSGFGLPPKCWGLLFFADVGTDGKVYACAGSWYEENDCYGSLETNTLKEIWESQRFKEVFEHRSITDKKLCFTQCHNIPMNAYLMDLKAPPCHINFI